MLLAQTAQAAQSAFPASSFPPVVLGLFGLGTGYLIVGPQELTGRPARDSSIERANGIWGVWMPGFCQFVAGTYLFVGLSWFPVFTSSPTLYMAAFAFSAYGVHWFALGWNRWQQADARPNGFMCVPFAIISALGAVVFFLAGSWPVGVLFSLLILVYVTEFFASFALGARRRQNPPGHQPGSTPHTSASMVDEPGTVINNPGERALGAVHILTGLWLMYLTFATTLNITSGFKLPGA